MEVGTSRAARREALLTPMHQAQVRPLRGRQPLLEQGLEGERHIVAAGGDEEDEATASESSAG